MDKTLNRRRGQSLGTQQHTKKHYIKIEGFQLTDKRAIKCT